MNINIFCSKFVNGSIVRMKECNNNLIGGYMRKTNTSAISSNLSNIWCNLKGLRFEEIEGELFI